MEPIEVRVHGGRGPAVVVLHGGPGAVGSMWQLAEDLSDEFRVFEPLQRQRAAQPLTVERHVEDLADVMSEPAAIVGHSWGAMLALSLASLRPSLVRSVALVGCGTYDEASREEYGRALRERLGPEGRLEYDELERRMSATGDGAERDSLRRARAALSMRAQAVDPLNVADADPDPPAGSDEWRGDGLGAEQTWADVLRLQREGIEPQRFCDVSVPVLMLHGDGDPHPGRATSETLRAYIPDLEFVELAGCGHTPWAERAARDPFFKRLRAFLRSTS